MKNFGKVIKNLQTVIIKFHVDFYEYVHLYSDTFNTNLYVEVSLKIFQQTCSFELS